MSLSRGRSHLATPGPSIIPERVLNAMHRPAPNIYEKEITDITESILSDLAKFASTTGEVVIYIANGHGVWEASLVNLFSRGERIVVISNGVFGLEWASLAQKLQLNVTLLDFGFHKPLNLDNLSELLRNDTSGSVKGVLCVQADTSSSVLNDIKEIKKTISDNGHNAMLIVDSIACFACDRIEMDDWGVDVLLTACQKGLMTPPGLSYCFVGERALAESQKKQNVSPYWDWKPRINPTVFYQRFFGTAPTHHLYGQREALDMILEEGRDNIFQRHEILAKSVWAAVEHWSKEGPITLNVPQEKHRSRSVTTLRADGYDLSELRSWLKNNTGLELGPPLGFAEEKFLHGKSVCRIAHMGHLNPFMIQGIISTIELGLVVCNIPHKAGGSEKASQTIISG
ncbi:MAG: aminotransferase class V-fold PLP-dependent enzyme [Pseudomonadota bacterium]|nr:aminotransferase class V-fold PLP-dependent enzyme [Pseudomonadota bacterium]